MKAKRCKIIDAYIRVLKSVNTEMMRMGHALALGALPAFMLKDNLNGILNALISATYTTPETLKWAESRRDAAKAITSICVSLDATIKTGEFVLYFLKNVFFFKAHFKFIGNLLTLLICTCI